MAECEECSSDDDFEIPPCKVVSKVDEKRNNNNNNGSDANNFLIPEYYSPTISNVLAERKSHAVLQEEMQDSPTPDTNVCDFFDSLEVSEKQTIKSVPPSCAVFTSGFCTLVNTENLTLDMCGLDPVPHALKNCKWKDLDDLLLLRMFLRTTVDKLHSKPVYLFLFRLMSVHEDENIVNTCFEMLCEELYGEISYWTPTVEDFIFVLVNYGVSMDKISQGRFILKPPERMNMQSSTSRATFPTCNLSKVLSYVALNIQYKQPYTTQQLCALIYVVFIISRDQNICGVADVGERNFLTIAINSLKEEDWVEQNLTIELAKVLHLPDDHHHLKRYCCCNVLPNCGRGRTVARSLAFALVQEMLKIKAIEYISDIKIKNINNVFSLEAITNIEDKYSMGSLLILIHFLVGSNQISEHERNDLKLLKDNVSKSNLSFGNRDVDACLLRTEVNLCLTRWDVLLNNVCYEQPTFLGTSVHSPQNCVQEVVQIDAEEDMGSV